MREQVARFGSNNHLVGILTEPHSKLKLPKAPNILFWNVGIHHRIGPNRIFVDLARELAQQGFVTLRFDIAGLGDSEPNRNESQSENERACSDVRAAMKFMIERTRSDNSVLVAFCSGVDAAHLMATTDSSVVGLVCIEGYRYKTRGYYLRYPLRYLDANRWERSFRARFPKFFPPELNVALGVGQKGEQVYVREPVTLEKFRTDIRLMVSRGMKLMFAYAGGDSIYSYRTQLFDMLDGQSLNASLHVEFYPKADHIFFVQRDRDQVVRDIATWAKRTFQAPSF
jgi:dienelactone hydrolase